MVVVVRIVDPEPKRDLAQEGGARKVRALAGKVVGHIECPLVRSDDHLVAALEGRTTGEPAVVVSDELSHQSRLFGRG